MARWLSDLGISRVSAVLDVTHVRCGDVALDDGFLVLGDGRLFFGDDSSLEPDSRERWQPRWFLTLDDIAHVAPIDAPYKCAPAGIGSQSFLPLTLADGTEAAVVAPVDQLDGLRKRLAAVQRGWQVDTCTSWPTLQSPGRLRVAPFDIRFAQPFVVVNAAGFVLTPGEGCLVVGTGEGIVVAGTQYDANSIPYENVQEVAVSGPGTYTTGGGWLGGGFGVRGMLKGMALATVANRLTTRTHTETYLRVVGSGCEAILFTDLTTPEQLDHDLTALRVAMRSRWDQQHGSRQAAEGSVVEQLERLSNLHRDGYLTDAEFAEQKRRLLGA